VNPPRRSDSDTGSGHCARWQRRPEERRSEILEAGFLVFGRRGYGRATIADVARQAGVSAGTVSHYFGSKRRLFEAVVIERALGFVTAEEEALASHRGSAREMLERTVRLLWDQLWTPGTVEFLRVMNAEASSFPESARVLCRQLNERWRRLVAAILELGVEAGEFEVDDIGVAARVIPYAVTGVAQKMSMYGRFDPAMPEREAMWSSVLAMVNRFVLAQATSERVEEAE
jgi:AcrR family transcriptional regulator